MSTIIGDALIRLVIDQDAASAGASDGRERRTAERSTDQSRRSAGRSADVDFPITRWRAEEEAQDREEAQQDTYEEQEEDAGEARGRAEGAEDVEPSGPRGARGARNRARGGTVGDLLKLRLAERLGRALTPRVLRRARSFFGRGRGPSVRDVGIGGGVSVPQLAPSTIGSVLGGSAATAVGIGAAGPLLGGVIATRALIDNGVEVSGFLRGLGVEDSLLATPFRLANSLMGPPRAYIDFARAIKQAGVPELKSQAAARGAFATFLGQELDPVVQSEMAFRAAKNATLKHAMQQAIDRTMRGIAAEGIGSGTKALFDRIFGGGNTAR